MTTFETLGTASAQLGALLDRRSFEQVAQLLDSLELQVQHWLPVAFGCGSIAGIVTCSHDNRAYLFAFLMQGIITHVYDPILVQVVTPQLPQGWPHTLHLLGHLYNHNLCESTATCAFGGMNVRALEGPSREDAIVPSRAERMHASYGSGYLQLPSR